MTRATATQAALIFAAVGQVAACTTERVVYRIPEPVEADGSDGTDGSDDTDGSDGAVDTGAPISCDDAGSWSTIGQPLALRPSGWLGQRTSTR